MAIIKAIETIENIYNRESRRRTTIIYADSRITIQSLKNYRNHKNLVKEIRKKSNRTGETRVNNKIYMD